jgi:hypothetical protein
MFRSSDHPQGAHVFTCGRTAKVCKELRVLPKDDLWIETCRSFLSVLM